ncbi:Rad52/Rad22 family DNA repair protein [Nitratiruptor tergarcus]|uniref:DNA repair and recombination protein RAD52 n=1 Tax=Nitratiruptor tergarcus DSM 16512 TaxID=1069081 RepID=A0A1W1WUW7_9BACT|nr:Rad52/Rad22 family DNA repair protein [Nitratiruptor tergarcus]SMC10077.1 DNA repair and recombination protein RAD52 [Nitratiruptor tergarcus DSM 16512]
MFTDKQIQLLKYNLDGKRVKTRKQGNIILSYLEGHDIIDTANFILGFGNWSYKVTALDQVSEETNQNGNIVIGYRAIVKVTVYNIYRKASVTREDVGFGTGVAKEYAMAHEGAGKEAVTDALKRAFRTFGNQFGNALYDKEQKNVDHSQQSIKSQHTDSNNQTQQDPYVKLKQLGLGVEERDGELIVTGSTYGKQQYIKPLGFRWDASRKVWYQPIQKQVA